MRKFTFFLLLLPLLACSSISIPKDCDIKVTVIHDDTGDDSNTTTEIYGIKGERLFYSYSYTGYHPDENFVRESSQKVKLTGEQLREVNRLIEEGNLNEKGEKDLSEGDPDGFIYGQTSYIIFTGANGVGVTHTLTANNHKFKSDPSHDAAVALVRLFDGALK